MKKIVIRRATANNLKNVDVDIPLGKLVAFVGKSGSGKSSLVQDLLFRASRGEPVEAKISKLPKVLMIPQRIKPAERLSLGQTSLKILHDALKEAKSGDLLIVDEPCVGLAKEDRAALIDILKKTVKSGVSVFVVEHSGDLIANSDHVIEFGPGSGAQGGKIVFEGPAEKFRRSRTYTSDLVYSDKPHALIPKNKDKRQSSDLTISGISKHALKNFTLTFPLGGLVCVRGRMATGKSTLLSVVYGALFKGRNAWKTRNSFKSIKGKNYVRRSYFVDQSPLGSSPLSTTATYLGIWDAIRDIYATLPESRRKKLNKGDFRMNAKLLPERLRAVNSIKYLGHTINEVSRMTMDKTGHLFSGSPLVLRKISFLQQVGLGYLTLGQKTNTLSGGEAQRFRLAKILSKKLGDRCVYILDTPSKGLHLGDLDTLAAALRKIAAKNNTVLIADNREELIEKCDEVITLEKK